MEIPNLHNFVAAVNQLQVKYDFSVTSWFRTEKHNKAVGGALCSWHLMGLAVDVVLDNISDKAFFLDDAKKLGLICLDEQDHIHLQVI